MMTPIGDFCLAIALRLLIGESVAPPVARRTNNQKVVSSRPTKVVCITVLTGNRLGYKLSAVAGHHSFFRDVGM